MENNRYAPPVARVDDVAVAGDAAPPLWNPGAAAAWSLLFSPMFGAYLQMKNWQALGEPAKAANSWAWTLGMGGVFVLFILSGVVLPDSKALDAATRFGGLGLLIAWYYASARDQVRTVKGKFGDVYPRKGWLKPIFITLGLWVALALLIGVIAVAFDDGLGG